MAVSDATIKELIKRGEINIKPFNESNLQPAGYDLRADQEVIMKPGEHRLLATDERVELSSSILGILHLKSSLAREGLFASLALVDPGFRGQLTVSLLHQGENTLQIEHEEPFLQLTFFQLSTVSERSYSGRYQESVGIVESKR